MASPKRARCFCKDLNSPFGMALVGDDLYVANTDAVVRFPYQHGRHAITRPAPRSSTCRRGPINHHWTKNVIASADGTQLYVDRRLEQQRRRRTACDNEDGRAAIWRSIRRRARTACSRRACAIRTVWRGSPRRGALWTAVNERDELGSDLVPDYMTSVKDGAFYGWPYSYYGQHVDARVKPQRPDLVAKAIAPDYALGSHTASLGLAFYRRQITAGALSAAARSSASTARGTAIRAAATR